MSYNKVLSNILESVIPELNNYMNGELNPDDEELNKLENINKNWVSLSNYNKNIIKQKPNELCKCNSGKKYKKCCHLTNITNNIMDNVNYDFSQINNIAVKLYNNTIREKLQLINPNEYFERQSINRLLFEKINEKLINHTMENELKSTSIYKYFSYMYNNYPPRIDYFINYFKNELGNTKYDILEIYYNLTK